MAEHLNPKTWLMLAPFVTQIRGSDIATILENGRIYRIFNPRKDNWLKHFELYVAQIIPKSNVGAATIKLLDLNNINRILERIDLIDSDIGCTELDIKVPPTFD